MIPRESHHFERRQIPRGFELVELVLPFRIPIDVTQVRVEGCELKISMSLQTGVRRRGGDAGFAGTRRDKFAVVSI